MSGRRIRGFAVVGGLAQSLAGAAGGLAVREAGGSDLIAGLPATLLTLGAAGAAVALSMITRRRGRGPALRLGCVVAAVGCGVVMIGGLPGIMIGSLVIGAGNAAVMLSRYALADLRSEPARARSIASVMVMITVGAVIGANLLAPGVAVGRLLQLPGLLGGYLVAGLAFLLAASILGGVAPAVSGSTVSGSAVSGSAGSPGSPAPRPSRTAGVAVAVLAPANLVMVAVMTMAPLHLAHAGTGLAAIGVIISLHIAAMFGPAVISGRITDRLGAPCAALIALALLVLACGAAALAGPDPVRLGTAMIMLGAGWNLATVAGSELLTAGVEPSARPGREGLGELGMGLAATLGGVGSGAVMAQAGYPVLAWLGAVVPVLPAVALLLFLRPLRTSTPKEVDHHVRTVADA